MVSKCRSRAAEPSGTLEAEPSPDGVEPHRDEFYDLCFPEHWEGNYRIQALLRVVRSPSYRRAVDELPGYSSAESGELQRIS
jgi:hypothetical protein